MNEAQSKERSGRRQTLLDPHCLDLPGATHKEICAVTDFV